MDRESLQLLKLKNGLYPIAKKLGIKYLTWMKKNELIDEIIIVENGGEASEDSPRKNNQKYMCEHNKQKYKCILCGGSHICEHKKQERSCKECRLDKEKEILFLRSLMKDF